MNNKEDKQPDSWQDWQGCRSQITPLAIMPTFKWVTKLSNPRIFFLLFWKCHPLPLVSLEDLSNLMKESCYRNWLLWFGGGCKCRLWAFNKRAYKQIWDVMQKRAVPYHTIHDKSYINYYVIYSIAQCSPVCTTPTPA